MKWKKFDGRSEKWKCLPTSLAFALLLTKNDDLFGLASLGLGVDAICDLAVEVAAVESRLRASDQQIVAAIFCPLSTSP